MANAILSAGDSTLGGNVRYFSEHHHAEAQRVALHTAALNALAMASWNLSSDSGSIQQAIVKAEQAVGHLLRLQNLKGGAV